MITQRGVERPPLSAARRSRLAPRLAMGKKSRAVPGRRPILQLSPPGPRSSTPGRDPEPEPDVEADSTALAAAAPSQPAPVTIPVTAAGATTTTVVIAATAAPEDSPSEEGEDAPGAPAFPPIPAGACETRARGLRPRRVGQDPERRRDAGGRLPPRPAGWGPAGRAAPFLAQVLAALSALVSPASPRGFRQLPG